MRLLFQTPVAKPAGVFFGLTISRRLSWVFVVLCFNSIAGQAADHATTGVPNDQFRGVVRQSRDQTCGLAALSTLMSYWHGDTSATEEELETIWASLPTSRRRSLDAGLTRADLAEIVVARGNIYKKPQWLPIAPRDISSIRKPVIALIRRDETVGHYVVVKGVIAGRVYMADPTLGNVSENLDVFISQWADDTRARGLVLVVDRLDDRALRYSPLALDYATDGHVRDLPVSDAILRNQILLPPGRTLFKANLERTKFSARDEVLPDGGSVRHVSRATTTMVSAAHGISDDVSIAMSSAFANISDTVDLPVQDQVAKRRFRGDTSFSVERLLMPKIGNSALAVLVGADLIAPTPGPSYGIGGHARIEQAAGELVLNGTLTYMRRFRLENADEFKARHSVALDAGMSYLGRANTALDLRVLTYFNRGTNGDANGTVVSFGVRTAIASGIWIGPSISFALGSQRGTTVGVGLAYLR